MGDEKFIQYVSWKKPKERDHLEDLHVVCRIILEWILGKESGRVRTGCIWISTGTSGGVLEHGNEPSCSIKGGEFLD
jgi:hypothetical protein